MNKTPKGVFHLVKGSPEFQNVYSFGDRDLCCAYDTYLNWMYKEAVQKPGEQVVYYHEENGYEYEYYAVFDPITNTITTNFSHCPSYCSHHVGSTCPVCGMKD